MARAKTTPVKEVKVITREQLDTLSEIKEALDNATDDIRDLGDRDQEQMVVGFTLGKLYQSLIDAYEKADELYDELDIDDEENEF